MADINKSNFVASFMQLNRLKRLGFRRWIFYDGMGYTGIINTRSPAGKNSNSA
jgi:hypothetical protein